MQKRPILIAALLALLSSSALAAERTVLLSDLDLKLIEQGYGEAKSGLSVEGEPLAIQGTPFAAGPTTRSSQLIRTRWASKVNASSKTTTLKSGPKNWKTAAWQLRFSIAANCPGM